MRRCIAAATIGVGLLGLWCADAAARPPPGRESEAERTVVVGSDDDDAAPVWTAAIAEVVAAGATVAAAVLALMAARAAKDTAREVHIAHAWAMQPDVRASSFGAIEAGSDGNYRMGAVLLVEGARVAKELDVEITFVDGTKGRAHVDEARPTRDTAEGFLQVFVTPVPAIEAVRTPSNLQEAHALAAELRVEFSDEARAGRWVRRYVPQEIIDPVSASSVRLIRPVEDRMIRPER